MGKPIKALDVYCIIVCRYCSKQIVGEWTRSDVPRATMRQKAIESGAVFDGHSTFCDANCEQQFKTARPIEKTA